MKVIKKGNTVKEHICENCGCIFEYSEKDIQTKKSFACPFSDYPFDFDIITCVPCPECNTNFVISSEQDEFIEIYKQEQLIKREKKSFLKNFKFLKKGGK